MKKIISIVTPCFNEELNILEIYEKTKVIFNKFKAYQYEHIFIDNNSQDNTLKILKEISEKDKNIKIIVNSRNFGHIRSPYYALLQASGEAAIILAADLQDPPQMIGEFIKEWEKGYKIVIGIKNKSKESKIMFFLRRLYYNFVTKIADIELIKNFTGFGLYDKSILKILKKINDPYPYLRGLISDIGFERKEIFYTQPKRSFGVTKNNFYTLYDIAMLGITNHSKLPIRLATIGGFFLSVLSLCAAFLFLVLKLISWKSFNTGISSILCGLFIFSSVQLFFIGLLGEYILSIHTRTMKRPIIIEKERINFNTRSN
ncbi:glycosyltransferase family 2 protein [Rickettsiella endosymbiont of Aleochara curtula]|uniref:glycosyltransferase family 2 protein n=1 Tax=Rickettsiella endosymbiont of Aleochara curtula TaxID=3077936 RepID=UPI00313C1ED6